MNVRVIATIAAKDLKAAVRDGRILLAMLLPLGLGVFYNFVMPESQKPTFKVAVYAVDQTTLPAALKSVAGTTVNLSIQPAVSAADASAQVGNKKVDAGLVVPAGFDAALANGPTPTLTFIQPETAGAGAGFVRTALDAALRAMAGQHPPATVVTQATASRPSSTAMGSLSPRTYTILGTLVMLIAMIAVYVLPVLLTEEYEKKTADTLLLIGDHLDIVLAKAAVGLTYIAVAVALFLVTTRIPVANPLLFGAGVLALAVTLIGYGLLMGGLARTVAQLNTWSSLPILLLVMPVFFSVIGFPSWVQSILDATPGMQATRLLVDGASTTVVHGNWPVAIGGLAAWAVVGYGLLVRSLARREA